MERWFIYCFIKSASIWGIEPYIVQIEADISQGMPYFNMVGLLSSEVKEARERVRAAIKNSGETLPMNRITINLSPADRRKEGAAFDLPIAISLLCILGRIDYNMVNDAVIVGELSLNGDIKGINGIFPIIRMAKKMKISRCIIPYENINEAKNFDGIEVIGVKSLRQIIEKLNKEQYRSLCINQSEITTYNEQPRDIDYNQIMGQDLAKRAIMIAVAGYHNILLIGPPGAGKSMLASRIPSIMSTLNMEEKLEVSSIHSIYGNFQNTYKNGTRPFRAPHHTITAAALIGGGKIPRPGEITLAHRGVLFLDELPEFHPKVIDALRQPLEEKCLRISRTCGVYEFPADFLFVGAMNPCRCGYYPDRNKCNCSKYDISNYLGKISGPLLDRMDMSVEVNKLSLEELEHIESGIKKGFLSSNDMKQKIEKATDIQMKRNNGKLNTSLTSSDITKFCTLNREATNFIHLAYKKFDMSMRSYYKTIKVARTIADLEGSERIEEVHIAEALGYRVIQKYWK